MKKITLVYATILSLMACLFTPVITASAMTFEEHISSFSLYCEDNVIKRESVEYKVSSVTDKKISGTVDYLIEGAQGEDYTFYIPVNCRYDEVPQYDVKVDGTTVPLKYLYGEPTMLYKSDGSIEKAIERSSFGNVDESIMGTLYKFTANSSKMTVSFDLEEKQSVIFQNGGSNLQSTSGINGYSYTVDTTAGQEYSMFVTRGDVAEIDATATFEKESKSCKAYIDENYYPYEDAYREFHIPIELIYSKMTKQLNDKGMVGYHDFFWSRQGYHLNFYTFTLTLAKPSVGISYTEETMLQTNSAFEPPIYLFERTKSGSYPTDYAIQMTQELPYVIENNVGLKKTDNYYRATSSQDSFYCVYSSEEKPLNKYEEPKQQNTWLIVGVCVASVLIVASIVGIIIYRKKG